MKRYTIEQKFKSAAAFLVILILFPYIVSVFVNGVDPEETTNENFYIRVKASEEEEADGIAEVEWNEYLTGVLAKDVPADTETEALKAQAVLVRTQISRALQRSTQAEETENQKSDRTGNVSDVILEIDYLSQKEMQDQWPADESGSQKLSGGVYPDRCICDRRTEYTGSWTEASDLLSIRSSSCTACGTDRKTGEGSWKR